MAGKSIADRQKAEQQELDDLRNLLATFDKGTFAALVYEQLKQDVGITGEHPAMIPVISAAMERAFRRPEREAQAKEFVWGCIYAYYGYYGTYPVKTKAKDLLNFVIEEQPHIEGYMEMIEADDGLGDKMKITSNGESICTMQQFRKTLADIQKGLLVEGRDNLEKPKK